MNDGMKYLSDCAFQHVEDLKRQRRYRQLKPRTSLGGGLTSEYFNELSERFGKQFSVAEFGRKVGADRFNFNLNDYLAIGRSSMMDELISELALRYPVGSHSSRLLGGDNEIFSILENAVSEQTGFDVSTYFHSGYSANGALVKMLSFEGVSFFSDSLNHASIIDGIRYSGKERSERHVFAHRDYETLEDQLKASQAKCKVIFSESIYSMDGTIFDLARLKKLSDEHGAVVVVDEAHSFGLHGALGAGLLEESKLNLDNFIGVYTCGKTVATSGAFISGPSFLRELIINTSRSFIYSTAPSPLVAASTLLSLKIIADRDDLRLNLKTVSRKLNAELRALGLDTLDSQTHIIPIICGDEQKSMQLSESLRKRRLIAGAIRPPTVPHSMSRVRLSLNAAVLEGDVSAIAGKVAESLKGI